MLCFSFEVKGFARPLSLPPSPPPSVLILFRPFNALDSLTIPKKNAWAGREHSDVTAPKPRAPSKRDRRRLRHFEAEVEETRCYAKHVSSAADVTPSEEWRAHKQIEAALVSRTRARRPCASCLTAPLWCASSHGSTSLSPSLPSLRPAPCAPSPSV